MRHQDLRLEIAGLRKQYPRGPLALDDIDLSVSTGVFGLLGPNGAGKSTLMRIIATLQEPDAGTIRFGDLDPLADRTGLRRQLGYLPQDFGLDPTVSALRQLDHLAELKGLTDRRQRRGQVQDLLERTNLWRHRRRKLGTFSGGMKQRFGIAQALLGAPRLLIVDEPTTGLDPEERGRFFNTLANIGERIVVILSTHLVDDVTELCHRMAILNEGRLKFVGTPRDALDRLEGRTWVTEGDAGTQPNGNDNGLDVTFLRARRFLGRARTFVLADQDPGPGFEATHPELEDAYFATLAGRLDGQSDGSEARS